jgi:hypothetical protein
VDILSGTSAGGINAVFLAKALAQKDPDLKQLEGMWLRDADIDTLLNDGGKTSLLDSSRMYRLLVTAMGDMVQQTKDGGTDPLADRIDLFVTTTDLNGLAAPSELTDEAIDERIHRMVFHFECEKGGGAGDSAPPCNPMLAFAATRKGCAPSECSPW